MSVQTPLSLQSSINRVRNAPYRRYSIRLADLVLALVALAAALPMFMLCTAAVWFESAGPIVVKQRRFGRNNKSYVAYRFRTSFSDDKRKGQLSTVGELLFTTHMDELPQLWNVLKGDVSLIDRLLTVQRERSISARNSQVCTPHF